jgi:3-oxoacyl-[acyl-carrier-protein] synthase II
MRRVVVTGIGALTPIGHGRQGFWDGLRTGRSAASQLTRFDASSFRSRLAAEIHDFDPADYLDSRRARRMDRFAQFAVAASQQAIADACLPLDRCDAANIGIYLGSALGGIAFGEEQHARFIEDGIQSVEPYLALTVFGGAGATNVAIAFGLRGPAVGNANSCASGAIAIGEAFHLIRSGGAPAMLAGGVEAPLAPLTFGAFGLIKAMSRRNDAPTLASRPFDRERDGFVMAEGAAILVLEDLERAIARGAEPIAEILGYATTNDAYHMIAPLPCGTEAARAMTLALVDAGIEPQSVDYLNAHATSTPRGDAAEALAIRLAFGDAAQALPVSGTKGLYGHALGASGAIEAALTALVLQRGWIPPTTNLFQADPECELAHVVGSGAITLPRIAMTNAFGFGGINSSLVLRRWDGDDAAWRMVYQRP